MDWSNAVVTNRGVLLLRRVLDGERLYLDFAQGGSGTAPPAALMAQTALVSKAQDLPIIGSASVDGGKMVSIQIMNHGLADGYHMQQIGIWAHIGSEEPVLFAILQDESGIPIPSESAFPHFALKFHAVIAFSNEAEFHVVIDPSVFPFQAGLPIVSDVMPQSQPVGALWFDTSGGPWEPGGIGGSGGTVVIAGNVHIGDTAPDDTELIWYDTGDKQ